MTTLRDVAVRAGVHPSTVSRALDPVAAGRVNEQTRKRIREVADSLGFKVDAVASGLRRGRTNTLGVVVPDMGNPYVAPTVRGIENSLEGRDYMAFIAETQDDSRRLARVLDALLARRVDAIITLASRRGDEAVMRRVASKIPVVLGIRNLPNSGLPGVVGDDIHGGWLAANLLADYGHTTVAELRGPASIISFVHRSSGFVARSKERGLNVVRMVREATTPSIEEGRALMTGLLNRKTARPTAVFAHNDLMALGAISAARAAGLSCPRDISVIGYNDDPLTAYTSPPLTTIAMAGYDLGRFSAEMALSCIEDPARARDVLSLQPTLVVRGSVGPPRG